MGKQNFGDRYTLGRTLGVGTFGKVKEGMNLKTKQKVAIKILNKSIIKKSKMMARIKTEITVLKSLPHHKHVVNLYEVLESKDNLYLVLELVEGGELFDKIKSEVKLNEETGRHYFQQLISALKFMHSYKICHRDLKLENLLVDNYGTLKVTDFGLSALNRHDNEVFKTTLGSPNYVAPEVLSGKGYNGYKADIWSCGVILYALLAGYLPFDENNVQLLFQKICTGDFQYPESFSANVINLLDNILEVDPAKRYSIHDIKAHPWFQMHRLDDTDACNEDELIVTVDENLIELDNSQESEGSYCQNLYCSPQNENNNDYDVTQLSQDDYSSKEDGTSADEELDNSITSGSPMRRAQHNKFLNNNSKLNAIHNNGHSDRIYNNDYINNNHDSSKHHVEQTSPNMQNEYVENKSNNTSPNDSGNYDEKTNLPIGDYGDINNTSDVETPINTLNRSPQSAKPPTLITAFDLIGIVSTQMLSDVFTRSLQEEDSIKTRTRFVSKGSPAKILVSIEETLRRMPDCNYQISPNSYEIYVTKLKQQYSLECRIQIFLMPREDEHMIECRRIRGNIFRYHEFFEEFQTIFQDVMAWRSKQNNNNNIESFFHHHLHSKNRVSEPSPLSSSKKCSKTNGKHQIQLRNNNISNKNIDKTHTCCLSDGDMPVLMEIADEYEHEAKSHYSVHHHKSINTGNLYTY